MPRVDDAPEGDEGGRGGPWGGYAGIVVVAFVVGLAVYLVGPKPAERWEFRGKAGACQVFEGRPSGRTMIVCPAGRGKLL